MPNLLHQQTASFAGGMRDSAAPTDYRPDEVQLLENGRPSFNGTAVERRGGSQHLHASELNGGAQCWGAIEYYTAAGAQQIIAFFGTSAFMSDDGGATWTDITGVLALDEEWYTFSIMRVGSDNLLFCANGAASVLKWDGTTLSALTASSGTIPAGVRFLSVSNNRLHLAGYNGVLVKASNVGAPDEWDTTAGAYEIPVQTEDGDPEIRGIFQFGSALLVFKRRTTNYVTGFGTTTLQVQAGPRGASRSVGCVGQRSVVAVGSSAVMWMSERGFEYWDGGAITLVSRRVQKFVDSIDWSAVAADPMRPCALYYERKHEYQCVVPRVGTKTATYVYRPPQEGSRSANYIFRRGDVTTTVTGYLAAIDGTTGALAVDPSTTGYTVSVDVNGYVDVDADQAGDLLDVDRFGYAVIPVIDAQGGVLFRADTAGDVGVPHEGTADGFVNILEAGDTDGADNTGAGGQPVTVKVVGRPLLFGDPIQRKRARRMRVEVAAAAASTVTMRLLADGVETFVQDVVLATTNIDQPQFARVRVGGRGRSLAPIVESEDAVQIQALEVEAYPLRRH